MAPFPFALNTKFAAMHLCRCANRGLPDILSFDGGLSAHSTPVMDLSDMDKGRIGKDYADAFESAIALMASMPSDTAGVLDAESIHLEHRAYMWLYGVLTQGVPEFWPGIITIGSKQQSDREPWANRIVIMDRFLRNTDVVPFRVTPDALASAAAVVPGLAQVFSGREIHEFRRVRRGFNQLIPGWKAGAVLDRLHVFVRAFDALMMLQQGQGEKQFAARLAMLVSGERVDEVAREIYRLRSFNEHLSDWPSKLEYIKEPDRPAFVSMRAFQAEALAGETYRRLLSDADLLRQFQTDASIESFWTNGAAGWTAIDLHALNTRFRYIGPIH